MLKLYTSYRLMPRRQLAFFGTHDIVDHLFGASAEKFDLFRDSFLDLESSYESIFNTPTHPDSPILQISYLIGILLDDLAQPKWYGSNDHLFLCSLALNEMNNLRAAQSPRRTDSEKIPDSFHDLVALLRKGGTKDRLNRKFHEYVEHI